MKKLFKTLAVVVLCSVFTGAVAMEPIKPVSFKVGTYAIKDTEKIKVLLEKQTGQKLRVQLIDDKSNILCSEIIGKKHKNYNLNLDLAALNPGTYRIEVTSGVEKFTKTLEISGGQTEVKTTRRLFAMR
jgi:hypothetical protein